MNPLTNFPFDAALNNTLTRLSNRRDLQTHIDMAHIRPAAEYPVSTQIMADIDHTAAGSQMQVLEAVLFVSDLNGQADEHCRVLDSTLVRLGVKCDSQRAVALLDQPLLGRTYRVRITPCLVLDTGSRHVQLLGAPEAMDAAALERALARG